MPPMSDFAYDVFLSHSSLDKERVRRLGEQLRADGLRVWLDAFEIRPGDHIGAQLDAGLEGSRVLLLCMSPHAFGSEWVQLEHWSRRFRDPLNRERRFLPVLFETCDLPDSLAAYRYVDYRAESPAAYAEIVTFCRGAAPRTDDGADVRAGTAATGAVGETNLCRRARLFPRLACPAHLRGAWG